MFGLTTWLCASLITVVQVQGYIPRHLSETQNVLGKTDFNSPLVVTVRGDATVSNPAEFADVIVDIHTSGLTEDAARQETTFAAERVEALLKDLSMDSGSWSTAPVRVQLASSQSRSTRMNMMHGDDLGLDGSNPNYSATSQFKIKFKQLDRLADLERNISTSSQINMGFTVFKLTEETIASARREVRDKALRIVKEAARDYGAMLGLETVNPLELEDSYTSNNQYMTVYGGWQSYEFEGADFDARGIRTTTNLKYKFSLT